MEVTGYSLRHLVGCTRFGVPIPACNQEGDVIVGYWTLIAHLGTQGGCCGSCSRTALAHRHTTPYLWWSSTSAWDLWHLARASGDTTLARPRDSPSILNAKAVEYVDVRRYELDDVDTQHHTNRNTVMKWATWNTQDQWPKVLGLTICAAKDPADSWFWQYRITSTRVRGFKGYPLGLFMTAGKGYSMLALQLTRRASGS